MCVTGTLVNQYRAVVQPSLCYTAVAKVTQEFVQDSSRTSLNVGGCEVLQLPLTSPLI